MVSCGSLMFALEGGQSALRIYRRSDNVASDSMIVPHISCIDGMWHTMVVVANPTPVIQTIDIRLFDDLSSLVSERLLAISPFDNVCITADRPNAQAPFRGWMAIDGAIELDVWTRFEFLPTGKEVTFAKPATVSASLQMNFLGLGANNESGFAVANLDGDSDLFTFSIIDQHDCVLVRSQQVIQGNGKIVALVSDFFDMTFNGPYTLQISGDKPLAGLGLMFTMDNNFIVPVPACRDLE